MHARQIILSAIVLVLPLAARAQCTWVLGDVVWGLNGNVYAMANLPNGDFIVGGAFTVDGAGHNVQHVARFDGRMWGPVGSGLNGTVRTLLVLPNGDLLAGGDFSVSTGSAGSGIARWNGVAWTPVGLGVFTSGVSSGGVYALALLPTGDLVAGGTFTHLVTSPCTPWPNHPCPNPVPVNHVARWNGVEWSPMGAGTTGNFSPVPGGGSVSALAVLRNGDVVAAGEFTSAGGHPATGVARWDGSNWNSMLGGTSYPADSLLTLDNGDLLVGGGFNMAANVPVNHIARWSPEWSVWTRLRWGVNSSVMSMTTMPNGDVIAGGYFTDADGTPVRRMARWNFSTWEPFGGVANGAVFAMALRPNGEFFAGGSFTFGGGSPGDRVARWVCRCPADLDNDGDFANSGTPDNAVTIEDLLYFLVGFEAGDIAVDLDNGTNTGTPDNAIDINDLLFFLNHFEAGC